MRLSIVIITYNNVDVIDDCLRSIFEQTRELDLEVIVTDNDSKDGTIELIRERYPRVHLIENRANLGFGRANNVGIEAATGDYILILNPDTIIHDRALDKWVTWAKRHPEAGAFGCRVLNPDGSFQNCARPFPTLWRLWVAALFLRPLGRFCRWFISDTYSGWDGTTPRAIDWQSGCCVLFDGPLLKELGGFDPQFFFNFDEVDLCRRVWRSGRKILYNPEPTITHIGGHSLAKFPVRIEIEKYRNRYRYFHKWWGPRGARRVKTVSVFWLVTRTWGNWLKWKLRGSDLGRERYEMYRVAARWNRRLDPVRFIASGEEPDVGYEAFAQPAAQ